MLEQNYKILGDARVLKFGDTAGTAEDVVFTLWCEAFSHALPTACSGSALATAQNE